MWWPHQRPFESNSLIYGKDYNGNVCGEGDYGNARFTTYPRLNEDLLVAAANGVSPANAKFFGVCVESCPMAGSKTCTYGNETCWTVAQDTEAAFFRCLPVASTNETILEEVCIDPEGADPACTVDLFEAGKCATVCNTKRAHKEVWEVEATGGTSPLLESTARQLAGAGAILERHVRCTFGSSTGRWAWGLDPRNPLVDRASILRRLCGMADLLVGTYWFGAIEPLLLRALGSDLF